MKQAEMILKLFFRLFQCFVSVFISECTTGFSHGN